MLSPRWEISAAEIAEILGMEWKDFLPWAKENLPPPDGQSLAETDWWYLGPLLRKFPDTQLAWILTQRYKDRVRRTNHHITVADPSISGRKFFSSEVAKAFGVPFRTFVIMMAQPEFPECDGRNGAAESGKWWWGTTLVAAYPDLRVHLFE